MHYIVENVSRANVHDISGDGARTGVVLRVLCLYLLSKLAISEVHLLSIAHFKLQCMLTIITNLIPGVDTVCFRATDADHAGFLACLCVSSWRTLDGSLCICVD